MLFRLAATLWIAGFIWTAQAGPLVQFRTILGDLEVELFDDKPVTTANFIGYVEAGRYTNMFFHRWVPGFVIQGGGFKLEGRDSTNAQIVPIQTFGQITNEYGVGRLLSNVYGTIAMAKTAAGPNTASSQWFFNLGDNSANLDNQNGGFTVFGKVLRGTNVLNRFNRTAATNNLYRVNLGSPLDELPVYSTDGKTGEYIFVDITLLQIAITGTAGAKNISWNSVAGMQHVVEFTTSFPPLWTALVQTNGTGNRMTVSDPNAAPNRFYRVRVIP